jgi:hypothetical protein
MEKIKGGKEMVKKVAVVGRGVLTSVQENLIRKFIGNEEYSYDMITQLTNPEQLKEYDYVISLINNPQVINIIRQSGKPYATFDIQMIQRGIPTKEQAEKIAKENNSDIVFGNETLGYTVSKTRGLLIQPIIELYAGIGGTFTPEYILNELYTTPKDKKIKILFIGFGNLSEFQKKILKKLIGVKNIEIDNLTKLETISAKEQIKNYQYIVSIPNPVVIDTLNKAKDNDQVVIVFTTKPVLTIELPNKTENIEEEIEKLKKEKEADIVLRKDIEDKVSIRLLRTDKILINPKVNLSYKDYIPA